MTVNKPAVRAFVEALRSDRYKQGRGRLVTGDADAPDASKSYCCLGVACMVAKDLGITAIRFRTTTGSAVVRGFVDDATGEISNCLLPASVARFYGFPDDRTDPRILVTRDELIAAGPYVHVEHLERDRELVETHATSANDDYLLNFNAIADAFERTYLDGFDLTEPEDAS